MPASRTALAAASALAIAAIPRPAAAIDRFEIQVYTSDIDEPGEVSLETHLNYTVQGTKEPEWDGQVPPWHAFRVTLEPAVGVTEWLEVGAYLQFMTAPGGVAEYGGSKLRTKLVVPERISGSWMLGINLEIGRVPKSVEQEQWANEFRPILGWHGGRWLVSVNPIFGFALSGPERFRPELEPCAKATWDTSLGFMNDLLPRSEQEHLLFAVLDLEPPEAKPGVHQPAWELNVGVGAALTDAPGPHVLVKAIVGRSF